MTESSFFTKTVGRRKTASATVEIMPGSGKIKINGRTREEFFSGQPAQILIEDLLKTNPNQIFDADAKVKGGGIQSQRAALRLALTRSLVKNLTLTPDSVQPKYVLTRDCRSKERRKYGLKKARKAPQFSKRLSYTIFSIINLFMSVNVDKIIEELKTLTLLEVVELCSRIEDVFDVDISVPSGRIIAIPLANNNSDRSATDVEKTTFDVVLESIADDKRVSTLKVVRGLTNLGLKEAKDFCSSLPKTVKEGVSKDEAEAAKKELESAGRKVVLK
jgi:large subunit ribosomal protein L7/L12